MSDDEREKVVEAGRTVGCCSRAAATEGRQHLATCVNAPKGNCTSCMAPHAKSFPCIFAV